MRCSQCQCQLGFDSLLTSICQNCQAPVPLVSSRRTFLRQAGGVGLSLTAASILFTVSSPLSSTKADVVETVSFVAYHGRAGSYHQTQFDKLRPLGYRIISLSVYDDPTNPLYAAVWVKR